MTAPLDAALTYARRGWRVIPIKPGEKRPHLDAWQDVATTDESLIGDWWARWPTYGVGIATGAASGIFVLDVDVANGKMGDEILADLEAEHGPLPDTVEVVTGSGGRHLYFRTPDGVTIASGAGVLGPGLDVRGEGGQVLAPPTTHPNGRRYEWEASGDPDIVAVAAAPDWLVELLTRPPASAARRERTVDAADDAPGNRFSRNVSWPELLEPDGARYLGTRTERRTGQTYEVWARPGVDHVSATLYYRGSDVLKVFTDSWGGIDADTGAFWSLTQGETYTKFGYYAARHHGGDHRAAARELATHGRSEDDLADWVDTLGAARSIPAPATDDADDGWDDPLPLGETRPADFPLDALPPWIADYCSALADEIQVPVDLCAQVALGAWSAACAGKAKIRVAGRWTEHLNLFVATAMPSGGGKSPISKRLAGPLRELEAELIELSRKEIAEAKARHKVAEVALRDAEKTGDPGRIRDAHLAIDALEVPAVPRLVVDDVTPEMLALLLHRHDGRMALISTEATMFDMACGLYAGGAKRVNNNVYLQGWSADPLVVDRKGSSAGDGTEIRVPEPVLTVAITVQPSTIAELRKHPELAGRGFTARFMYAIPRSLVGRRDRWKVLVAGNDTAAETYRRTFLDHARLYASWQTPAVMTCSDEAAKSFVGWMHDMEPLLGDGGEYEPVSEWTAKLHASVARVAGLLHLAEGNDWRAPVELDTMRRAIAIGEYWVSHAIAIADLWDIDDTTALARLVAERLAGGDVGEFDASTLHRQWHRRRIERIASDRGVDVAEVVRDVLVYLVERNWVRPVDGGPVQRMGQGKAKQRFQVNPRAIRPITPPPESAHCARERVERDFSLTLSPSIPLSESRNRARNARNLTEEQGNAPSPQPTGWLWADPDADEGGAA